MSPLNSLYILNIRELKLNFLAYLWSCRRYLFVLKVPRRIFFDPIRFLYRSFYLPQIFVQSEKFLIPVLLHQFFELVLIGFILLLLPFSLVGLDSFSNCSALLYLTHMMHTQINCILILDDHRLSNFLVHLVFLEYQ